MTTTKNQEITYVIFILVISFIFAFTSSGNSNSAIVGGAIIAIITAAVCGSFILGLISIFYGKFSRRRLLMFTAIFSLFFLILKFNLNIG